MNDLKKCRVLFVEDEPLVAMLIEDMLIELGIEVVGPASKLEKALELAREAAIEAAVLDINIRGVLTFPVADLLLERGIPVIFATGYGSSVLPERFRRTQTLQKPFDQLQFAGALRAALADSPCEIEAI
jgi:CheY-like chemotaxis protein